MAGLVKSVKNKIPKQILHKSLLLIAGLLSLGLLLAPKPALATTSTTVINFQGKVVNADGTNVSNGSYNFDFVLYDDPTLGSPSDGVHDKWHELTKSVSVTNGVFQTELGSATALPNFNTNPDLYLAVRFNADAAGYMSPRIHLNTVPYAKNADALSGLTSANFVQLAQGVQTDGSTTNASIAINKTGSTANILTLQKSSTSVLVLDNGGLLTLQPAASLTAGSHITQTLTVAQVSGTVDGYSQTITVSPSAAATTNGFLVSLTDATTFANTTTGANITVTDNGASGAKTNKAVAGTAGGSNASAVNYGGYFGLSGGAATSSAIFGTNGTATGNILELQDATSSATDVFLVADGGGLSITPKGNNIGTIVRQTTGTATSGNVFDVQTANGSSHFFTIANSAANEGAVTLQSIGATRDLTLVAGSGSISLGTTTTVSSTNGLTLQAGSTISLLSTTSNSVTVDSGTTGSVVIGATNNTNAKAVSIGNNNSGSTVDIDGGTAAAAIEIGDTSTAHGIKIGANAAGVQTIVVGNAVASSALTLQAGSGNASLNVTSGTLTLQTTTSGQINLTPAASSNIVLGTSNTTGELLVLDTDTDAAFSAGSATNSSTEVNGAMFYSSTNHNFMCGIAGSWLPCSGLLESNTSAPTAIASCTTACAAYGAIAPIPANYCQAGRVIHVIAKGVWSTGNGANASSIQFGLFYGVDGTTRGNDTQVGSSTQVSAVVTAGSNFSWKTDFTVICFDTTHMMVEWEEALQDAALSTTVVDKLWTSNTTASTAVVSTSAKNLYIFPTYSASQAADTSQLQQLIVTGN